MKESLQQFAQQLATWTSEVIDRGRTPFRKVETCATVETEVGRIEIALVFWINRQSLMAGGLVLLPDGSLEEELQRGRHAARALGLNHFVTWEKNQVRIWHCDNATVSEQQNFPLKDPNYLETFRFVLDDLLEALKLTAVLGAVPTAELGTPYFHNLAQITLQQALPSLIETYRSQRSGDGQNANNDIDSCAEETNRQTLLQILALLWRGEIPASIMPETLEKTLEIATGQLEDGLKQPLSLRNLEEPPLLPLEAAVAFHHFLLRLRQLSWNSSTERIEATLNSLSESWFPDSEVLSSTSQICLYPTAPPRGRRQLILSESPSLLALTAMLQSIPDASLADLHFNHMFKLEHETFPPSEVEARLVGTRALTTLERGEFVTRLRKSWPHRRFKLRTGQPYWYWECIHLLGISHNNQKMNLQIPLAALQTAADSSLWPLLNEQFCIRSILQEGDNLKITLLRASQGQIPVVVHHKDEQREVTATEPLEWFRNKLLLALELPAEVYHLLDQELVYPPPKKLTGKAEIGMQIYRQSRCFQLFQAITDPNSLNSPDPESTDQDSVDMLPAPEARLLEQLADEHRLDRTVDQSLAAVLLCPSLTDLSLPAQRRRSRSSDKKAPDKKQFLQLILDQADTFGIPNFPEQYLYFLDQPQMQRYRITPPLTEKSRILGEFTLEDAKGHAVSGFGEELEQALLFCSQANKDCFELPADREQLNIMLQHYKKDLNALYEHISNICYSSHEDAKEARKRLNKAWKKLSLPVPTWFKN